MDTKIARIQAPKYLDVLSHVRLELDPEYSFKYVPAGNHKEPKGYKCSIIIGDKEYSTNAIYGGKEEAAKANANLAINRLFWKTRGHGGRKPPKIIKEADWIPASTNDDIYKSASDEILATLFKAIVYHSTEEEDNKPYYHTQLYSGEGITGYMTTLEFRNVQYKSIGLMTSQVQAEQSAAEVCLRSSLGVLSAVQDESEFIIQPYQGGVSVHVDIPNLHNIPYIFTTRLLSDLLEAFIDVHHMQYPKYYTKDIDDSSRDGEGNSESDLKFMDCICCFEGKVFKSRCPQTLPVVKQILADDILRYFGVTHPQERLELFKHVKTFRYPLPFYTSVGIDMLTPFGRSLSQRKGWKNLRPVQLDNYNDDDVEILFTSEAISHPVARDNYERDERDAIKETATQKQRNDEYMQKIVREEMRRPPSFKGEMLTELRDISVAKIDLHNADMFIIGNSQFSIKMLLADGKIYSKKRQANVDLLPGHNIQGLTCEYRVAFPSLEIYLKGVECWDLLSPNPPLPVVSSCGVVVLFHDYNISNSDVYVLLHREMSGFAADSDKVRKFCEVYVGRQTKPTKKKNKWTFPAANCTQNIQSWLYSELKLLSEMTVDSFTSVMTRYCYKSDWMIKMFENENLCPPMKELQDICLAELKRRDDAGLNQDEDITWELPQSQFMNLFETIGIHLENSNLCAFRAVAESAGVRIKLSDIEKSPTVDILCGDNVKKQSGEVSRYYIWRGCQKYTIDEKSKYYKEVDQEELARAGQWDLEYERYYQTGKSLFQKDHDTRVKKWMKRKKEDKMENSNKKGSNQNNTEGNKVTASESSNIVSESNESLNEDKGKSKPGRKLYEERCAWMKLDDAVLVCPMLMQISQTQQFQDELRKLITEANNLMKSKDISNTVKTSLLQSQDKMT